MILVKWWYPQHGTGALNGYAVADCSGMSDKYQIGDEAVQGYDCRMTPTALACYSGLYRFITNNYNIRADGFMSLVKVMEG